MVFNATFTVFDVTHSPETSNLSVGQEKFHRHKPERASKLFTSWFVFTWSSEWFFSKELNFMTISNIFDNVFSKTCHILCTIYWHINWWRKYIFSYEHVFRILPIANDLNRNVLKVKSWVWKFKMFQKYHMAENSKRSFQFSWMQGRPWLKYTYELMFCTACKEDGVTEKDSVFGQGSAMMRQDGIKYHEASDRHKRAISTQLLSNTIKYIFSFWASTIWFGQVGY